MTLYKANQILANHQADLSRKEVPDLIDAINLGRVAFDRILMMRSYNASMALAPLVGEDRPADVLRSLHHVREELETPQGKV